MDRWNEPNANCVLRIDKLQIVNACDDTSFRCAAMHRRKYPEL